MTVVAGTAARAEVTAKSAFVAGFDQAIPVIAQAGCTGLVVDDHGRRHLAPGVEAFLR